MGLVFVIAAFACAGIGMSQLSANPYSDAKPFLIAGFVVAGIGVLMVVISLIFGVANVLTDY